jgi:uncharacterized membrane protein YhaH (DUF805 family)
MHRGLWILRPYWYLFAALFILNLAASLFFLGALVLGPVERRSIALKHMVIQLLFAFGSGMIALGVRRARGPAAPN